MTHNCNDQFYLHGIVLIIQCGGLILKTVISLSIGMVWSLWKICATGNSSALVFNRAINNNYTEYHTSYWTDGKLLVGAGPIGNNSGENNWVASNACVFTTNGNLHLIVKMGIKYI